MIPNLKKGAAGAVHSGGQGGSGGAGGAHARPSGREQVRFPEIKNQKCKIVSSTLFHIVRNNEMLVGRQGVFSFLFRFCLHL